MNKDKSITTEQLKDAITKQIEELKAQRRLSLERSFPSTIKTMKVDVRTWDTLKSLKKENETFNDVIKELLKERTMSIGNANVKAIKYSRKVLFLKTDYDNKSIGIEFEYNDIKNQKQDFTLDLKIKKVFHGKRILNPSTFFGVDSEHKHLNIVYLNLYLRCVALALEKEFRVYTGSIILDKYFEDIALWRKIYYDYSLSEESFVNDVEEPLKLSEEEPLTEEYKKRISESVSGSFWGILK